MADSAQPPDPPPPVNRVFGRTLLGCALVAGGGSLLGFAVWLVRPFSLIRLELPPTAALAWDALLSLLFFVQHSGMIRSSFRRRLPAWLPPPAQPAFYGGISGVALAAVVLLWQPVPTILLALPGWWRLAPRLLAVLALIVFAWGVTALQVFDPFGRRTLDAHLRGRPLPRLPLAVRGPYRWVRHPLYSCMLVWFWAVPDLTADRILFNALWSAWIVLATRWEERDLVAEFGDAYREYQRVVPMLVPWRGDARRRPGESAG